MSASATQGGHNKCQVVTFGRSVDKSYKYTIRDCNNQTIPLKRGIQVLDLGVCFDEKLSFKEHIHAKINKAYMMLGLIKRNFKYLTIPTFIQLYISMVRSHPPIRPTVHLFGHHIGKELLKPWKKCRKEQPKFYQH